MQTNFADTIVNITITGPLVRIDLATISPVKGAGGNQELQATQTQQLVMPLNGFVRSFSLQEDVVKRLRADGVIKPHDQGDASEPGIILGPTTHQ